MPLALNHVATAAVLLWAGSGAGFADPGETPPIRSSKEYAEQARSHLTNGDFSRAIDVCRTGLEADSTSKVLLNLLAAAYAGEGRYAPAIQALERVVQLAPGSVLTYLNLGGIHTKLGQYDAAERYLSRASVLAPSQPEIRRRLAEVYLGTNRYREAAEQIEHALRLFPDDATLYYFLGRSLEGGGRDRAALEAFENASRLDIGFTEAVYRTALLARKLGEEELSRSAMVRYRHLGQVGAGSPDVVKQLNKLRASIMNAPEDPAHHLRLGSFFARHGYVEEALNKFGKVARLAPEDAGMMNKVGGVLLEHGLSEEALEYFRRGLAAQPEHLPTLIAVGRILSVGKQHGMALAHFRKAVSVAPEDPRGWYYLALGQLNAGRYAEARESLRTGESLNPSQAQLEGFRKLEGSLPRED